MTPPTPDVPRIASSDAAATERLLDRAAPADYLEASARALAAPLADDGGARASALAFRLGDERFQPLSAGCVREVHVPPAVHRVPGRTNEVFRGLVCLRGELHLCADLYALLGCARDAAAPTARRRRSSSSGTATGGRSRPTRSTTCTGSTRRPSRRPR